MNPILADYLACATATLVQAAHRNDAALTLAGKTIADAYADGKTVYVFGCTHSAILAEDVFYRAGAPAFWRPLWGPGMSIATTPGFLTSAVERSREIGEAIIDNSQLEAGDVLVVISSSGKNAAPVAVAAKALERGAKLILISSSFYRDQRGNHGEIGNLWEFADRAILLDNAVPCGDAAIEVADCPMGPVSTIAGSFLMHALSALAVAELARRGLTPPVFLSSNAPGGKAHNEALLAQPGMREAFMLP